jgi:hypothetical protein
MPGPLSEVISFSPGFNRVTQVAYWSNRFSGFRIPAEGKPLKQLWEIRLRAAHPVETGGD